MNLGHRTRSHQISQNKKSAGITEKRCQHGSGYMKKSKEIKTQEVTEQEEVNRDHIIRGDQCGSKHKKRSIWTNRTSDHRTKSGQHDSENKKGSKWLHL